MTPMRTNHLTGLSLSRKGSAAYSWLPKRLGVCWDGWVTFWDCGSRLIEPISFQVLGRAKSQVAQRHISWKLVVDLINATQMREPGSYRDIGNAPGPDES